MITISDALNKYLSSTTRLEGQYVRAEITTKSGVKYIISDDEFSGGTIKLNKKSVSGSSFDIGECYINDVSLTIIDKNNKYSDSFDNAELSLYFGVANSSLELNEEIQLGKFIIPTDTTVRKIASLQLSGDSMLSKFDAPTNGVTTSGTPYALVNWCCDICGVELALSEDEFNALSENTKYTFYIEDGSSIDTYRDIIMYVSQIIGGFATDTNDGKLTFKTYNSSNDTFNINNDTIASSKLGDSSYKLNGLSIVFEGKTIYINGDNTSDYLLELESNPLFDSLTEDLVTIIGTNIWNQLSNIEFRSFDFQYNGNPALECGDILNNEVRGVSSYITSLTWVYHGKSSVVGSVLDKRTKTQSQGVKKASTTGGGGSSNDMKIIKYINTEEYSLDTLETKVIQMYFNLPSNVSPLFHFVMVVKNEMSGLISLRIIYDNVDVLLKPKYQCSVGYHTLTFTNSLDKSDAYMTHSLSVYATFSADSNQESSSSNPCVVELYGIEANLMGYKAETGTPEWNGRYELTDSVKLLNISNDNINLLPFSVNDSYKQDFVNRRQVNDSVKLFNIDFDNINILPFSMSEPTFGFDVAPVYNTIQMSASDAVLSGSSKLRSNSSALSGYDIDYIGDYPDDGASWSINLDVDTNITLIIKAASDDNRYLDVYIDDVIVSDNLLYNTGSYNIGVENIVVVDYALSSGNHTIGVGKDTGSYAPLVDYIIVKYKI